MMAIILTDKMCLDLAKAYLGKIKNATPEDINECAEELKRVGERCVRIVLTGDDGDGD